MIGLDAGRKVAARQARRKRVKDRIALLVVATFAVGVLGGAAYVGYTIYDEQQDKDAIEREQRQAELEREGTGDDLRDAIDELEESPAWNGPGNPTFGVGDEQP